jgi:ABC-type nitrate/sulfonate/bicarbonate transport system substrate-binding protein
MQQALTSDSIDIGIGGGPGLGFMAKGVPAKGIAAMAAEPRNMAIVVSADSPVKSLDDLKGKKIGVTTVGSLTDWLAIQMAMQKGWGPKGVTTVPVGGFDTSRAALKTRQVDALVFAAANGYVAEEAKEWRVLQTMAQFAPEFITHVLFGTDKLLKQNPDAAGRFLTGWFQTIDWMKANKQRTVEISAKVLNLEPSIMSRTFDAEIGMFSTDGVFDPKAMAVLKKSFIDMQIVESEPKDSELIDTRFLPVKR